MPSKIRTHFLIVRRLRESLRWRVVGREVLRYALTMAIVVAMVLFADSARINPPYGGILGMTIILGAAWFAGLGPALMLTPTLFVVSRWNDTGADRYALPPPNEVLAITIITLISAATGLAGQYRRRIDAVKQENAQKLRDQARALSHAHIVFRDVQGAVMQWNEGAEKLFGWSSPEATGQLLHQLLRTEFSIPLEEINVELLYTGQWHGEVVHYRKDGSRLNVSSHWILYRGNDGAPIGVAEVHNDVTELRRAEEAIREADRRKDEFLALLAHELRNPLAPIRTGLELMKMAKNDPQTLENTRTVMERQTKQLVTLVDDLLDVSRITRGKLELRKSRVKLADIVQSAIEAAQPFIEDADHELTVIVPDAPMYLNADPHRLAQVLSNLLNNAAKYTPDGGEITFSVERQGSDVLIQVRDTGIGIPAHMLDRIFEMFTQVDHSIEKSYSGLGIGLTLAKSLVEMHGGTIGVQSDGPEQGTTFSVRLPLLIDIPTVQPPAAPRDIGTAQERRVLVVDDNQAAASLLSSMVKMLGNDVRTAGDGAEAIDVADEFRPDIVLMDLGMHKLNGYDAARHIRKQPWGREMLLIALTGWGQDGDKRRTKEAGFDYHLVKPADPNELQTLLTRQRSNGNGRSLINAEH